jgi:hypothetical protein
MSAKQSITNADGDRLVDLVREATRRVFLVSPGLSIPVVDELIRAWKRLGNKAVNVVIDVDPEVCRLGYGSLDAITRLREYATGAGILVCHQPGIRIGLLISDDKMLVFSPTPLLVEAGSHHESRPNALLLDAVPEQVATDVGLGSNPDRERVVGMDAVTPAQVESVANDLASAPPLKFDLARQVRVFTNRFQFVELEMTGCFVSHKKVPIPSHLVGLANNREVQSQFHAHFNLITKGALEVLVGKRKITEKSLRDQKQEILRRFLTPLKNYGQVVLKANKAKLELAVKELEMDVAAFQAGLKEQLQLHINSNVKVVVDALLPAVIRTPPDTYTKRCAQPTEADLRARLEEDITKAFGKAEVLVRDMNVSLIFKDLAYESLVDEDFLQIVREAMPDVRDLYFEFDAAGEAED